jgi:hypothetical protein
MDDIWHDVLRNSSSEESEILMEKEELANEILRIHIPSYHQLNPQNDLKWYDDVYNIDVLACTILITYCFTLQKLKAKCI